MAAIKSLSYNRDGLRWLADWYTVVHAFFFLPLLFWLSSEGGEWSWWLSWGVFFVAKVSGGRKESWWRRSGLKRTMQRKRIEKNDSEEGIFLVSFVFRCCYFLFLDQFLFPQKLFLIIFPFFLPFFLSTFSCTSSHFFVCFSFNFFRHLFSFSPSF